MTIKCCNLIGQHDGLHINDYYGRWIFRRYKRKFNELWSDENLHIRFKETSCDKYWLSIKTEYPEL